MYLKTKVVLVLLGQSTLLQPQVALGNGVHVQACLQLSVFVSKVPFSSKFLEFLSMGPLMLKEDLQSLRGLRLVRVAECISQCIAERLHTTRNVPLDDRHAVDWVNHLVDAEADEGRITDVVCPIGTHQL